MKVSVVIPVYNEEKYIEKCLGSLMKQEEKPDEIIVVDNNCTDKTMAIVKKYKGVKIIKEKKQGITPARNAGFNLASGDIIARCDADTITRSSWIKVIKKEFLDSQTMGISGPVEFYDVSFSKIFGKLHEIIYFKLLKFIYGYDFMFGSNMAITKKIWKKIKHITCQDDKKIHEDIDLSYHIAPLGKIKYVPELKSYVSARRMRQLSTYFEYPYRTFIGIKNHLNK
jgi:glycosyltransferase involved in cell wall biosynthesis